MKHKSKIYLAEFLILVLGALGVMGFFVVKVDPFFHYHKPFTDRYFYYIDNHRSQNDGITRHFEYDALITGTSMTDNFKSSEMDKIFSVNSIKVPYPGGSYKEINACISRALKYNPKLKMVVRGVDTAYFFDDKDRMRDDLGRYPDYLYDRNIFNDVNYIFNKNVIWGRVYPMVINESSVIGITSFDSYSNSTWAYIYGISSPEITLSSYQRQRMFKHITNAERIAVLDNIHQNVTSLAEEYPNVVFYYFFPPYSVLEWKNRVEDGSICKWIEAEQLVIEEILKYPNIKLYSFNNNTNITTDLNNYKDEIHYGEWINSLMLKWMHDGEYLLSNDNYREYLSQELAFYISYDYGSLADSEDYESDYYAAALWNKELNNVEPISLSDAILKQSELHLNDIAGYRYLVFFGKKNMEDGEPNVLLRDKNGKTVAYTVSHEEIDNEWHQYVVDVSDLNGEVDIVFDGCDVELSYMYRNVALY